MAIEHENLKIIHVLSQETSTTTSERPENPSEIWNRVSYRFGRLDTENLRNIVPDLLNTPVFMCGPEAMMHSIRNELLANGMSADRIHTEEFVSPKAPVAESSILADAFVETSVEEGDVEVLFRKSSITCVATADRTVLEIAEENDIEIAWECRAGICGQCKVRCSDGRVKMETRDALSVSEAKAGWILACQARSATKRIEVDA